MTEQFLRAGRERSQLWPEWLAQMAEELTEVQCVVLALDIDALLDELIEQMVDVLAEIVSKLCTQLFEELSEIVGEVQS